MKLKKIKVDKKESMDMPMMASYPPSFNVTSEQMPEIKKWQVVERYYLMVEVEQKSIEKTEKGAHARFDIISYHEVEETDEEFEKKQAKALSS